MLLLTVGLVLVLMVLRWVARGLSRLVQRGLGGERTRFWTRQAINLGFALLLLGVLSIWFDDPIRPGSRPGWAWSPRDWPSPCRRSSRPWPATS